ncbi:MAG: hypothetical protein CVT88_07690, partial [Candidatus Altiarchaeales archaeon HGW-Altiarchaeales-1]
ANASVLITNMPELSIVKTADKDVIKNGENVTFTINVTNPSLTCSAIYNLTDTLPTELITSNTTSWTNANLASNTTQTYTITATANTTECINVTNIANLTYENNTGIVSKDANASVLITNMPELTIIKTADKDVIKNGENVTFTVNVTNPSLTCSAVYNLTDTLPTELTTSDVTLWTNANIAPNTTQTYTITATANTRCKNLTNIANLTYENNTGIVEKNATANVNILCICNLTILKNSTPSATSCGENVTYTITVINPCDYTAYSIDLQDFVPEPIIANSSTTKKISKLAPNSTFIWTINATVRAKELQECVVNVVNMTYWVFEDGNWTQRNGTANATTCLNCTNVCPSTLNVNKTANVSMANYGDIVKWTINITNIGRHVATNVAVNDTLPMDLQNLTETNILIGDLQPGQTTTIEILAKVISNDTKNITNIANVEWFDGYTNTTYNRTANATVEINICSINVSVNGIVFNDTNSDGLQNAGENGISGVNVSIDGMTATTNANGTYKFIIQIPCNTSKTLNITVQEISGMTNTTTRTVEVEVNATNNATANFGFTKGFSFDASISATTSSGDISNSKLCYGDEEEVRFYITIENTDNTETMYNITVMDILPDGLVAISSTQGSVPELASRDQYTKVIKTKVNTTEDKIVINKAIIEFFDKNGKKYTKELEISLHLNNNCTESTQGKNGEVTLSDIYVEINGTTANGSAYSITGYTDSDGNLKFINVPYGNYTVNAVYVQTDGTKLNGTSGITIDATADIYEILFGFKEGTCKSGIGGKVFDDTNNNSIYDTGDGVFENASVSYNAIDESGGSTKLTNATGDYLFYVVEPGKYNLSLDMNSIHKTNKTNTTPTSVEIIVHNCSEMVGVDFGVDPLANENNAGPTGVTVNVNSRSSQNITSQSSDISQQQTENGGTTTTNFGQASSQSNDQNTNNTTIDSTPENSNNVSASSASNGDSTNVTTNQLQQQSQQNNSSTGQAQITIISTGTSTSETSGTTSNNNTSSSGTSGTSASGTDNNTSSTGTSGTSGGNISKRNR